MRAPRPLVLSFGASGFVQVLTASTTIVLGREFAPSERGALAAILLWPSVLAVLGALGVGESTTYYAARARRLGTLLGTSLVVGIVEAAVLLGVAATIVPFVLGGRHQHAVALGYAAAGALPLAFVSTCSANVLQGMRRFRAFQLLRVLQLALAFAALIGLIATHSLSLSTAVAVSVTAQGVTGLAAFLAARRAVRAPLAYDRRLARLIIGYGIRSHTSTIASLLNERLDQMLISLLLAPAALGLYVTAVALTAATNLVGTAIAFVAVPVIAHARSSSDRATSALRFTRLAFAVSAAVTIPVLLATPQLIRILFGARYTGATTVTRILLAAAFVYTTSRVLVAVLRAVGRPLDAGIADGAALVLTVVLLVTLLPTLGIAGAGIASCAAYSVAAAGMLYRASSALGVSVLAFVLPWSARRAQEVPA